MTATPPWLPPTMPATQGRHVRIEPFHAQAHGERLFNAVGGPGNAPLWQYMPARPFETADALADWLDARQGGGPDNWRTHMLLQDGEVTGMASYMRMRPEHGSVEIGCIVFAPHFQRTAGATEAMALMAGYVFDELNYRRYEWKCHGENVASRKAAERLGFTFEGTFRQDMWLKGRNRDTDWLSILDSEWPRVKAGLDAWLSPGNFDTEGLQRQSLRTLRESL